MRKLSSLPPLKAGAGGEIGVDNDPQRRLAIRRTLIVLVLVALAFYFGIMLILAL